MNIMKRELKAGLKPFLFWAIGLFVFVFAGIAKATGVLAGGGGFAALIESIPRIVQAVVGMVGVDIGTFGGYYAVLAQYAVILTAVYAAYLGNNAVSRESVDKTYEFVFTKPRSRSFILSRKLLSGGIYLTAFCVLDFMFSIAAIATLELSEDMTVQIALFATSAWFVGLVFFALATMFATMAKNTEKGAKYGNITILACYALGVAYDMMENGGMLKLFTPFKYFAPKELLVNRLDALFVLICLAVAGVALFAAFKLFEKRDLSAV